MGRFIIRGGHPLKGDITVQGSKNAALPILAASVLNNGFNSIGNCPQLRDVDAMIKILSKLGCKCKSEGNTVLIDSSTLDNSTVPEDLASEMRSSVIFMGPLLARCGKAVLSYPGGCEIGPRPIDLHLKALKLMGAKVHEIQGGYIKCEADKLKGCEIQLDYPSVGATENILLASVFAEGETVIRNAAKEPEVVDLQNFLVSMGANVTGAGNGVIQVTGVKRLSESNYSIIPDRIVTGTYMTAAAITGGDVRLNGAIPFHLHSVISVLKEAGCNLKLTFDSIRVSAPGRLKAVDMIRTLPFPGFPTDMQPQIVALLSIADSTSIVVETVFENRFRHAEELTRMGANITIEGRMAVIKGVRSLTGANVNARDLRSGAALVLAGLSAEGETVVYDIKHIERGYEDIENKLKQVEASIRREED